MLFRSLSGNRSARKVLYNKYLDFVANEIHYYFDLVMPQGKYYISLPKLITLVTCHILARDEDHIVSGLPYYYVVRSYLHIGVYRI